MISRWRVSAVSEQEISIGGGATRAFLTPSQLNIPGSTLRGAIAAAWRVEYGDGCSKFREIFDGAMRFGPLLAVGSDVASQSVWECKYHSDLTEPRFIDEAMMCASCRHEAIEKVCSKCRRLRGTTVEMCGRSAEPLKGDIRWGRPNTKVVTSTAIHPERKTALEGSLFAREAHRRNTEFVGHVFGAPELLAMLGEFTDVTIGARGSVMGRTRLTWSEDPLNLPDNPESGVVVRTISPTILVDAAGRPTTDLTAAFPEGAVIHVWGERLAASGTSGWHAASATPKPDDVALAPGVVVALRGMSQAQLAELLSRGIGIRRAEGFGWLELVDKPWQSPTARAEVPAETVARKSDFPCVDELSDSDRKWLADQLMKIDIWDEVNLAKLKELAGGKNIQGLDVVVKGLTGIADPDHAAFVTLLRRK